MKRRLINQILNKGHVMLRKIATPSEQISSVSTYLCLKLLNVSYLFNYLKSKPKIVYCVRFYLLFSKFFKQFFLNFGHKDVGTENNKI